MISIDNCWSLLIIFDIIIIIVDIIFVLLCDVNDKWLVILFYSMRACVRASFCVTNTSGVNYYIRWSPFLPLLAFHSKFQYIYKYNDDIPNMIKAKIRTLILRLNVSIILYFICCHFNIHTIYNYIKNNKTEHIMTYLVF